MSQCESMPSTKEGLDGELDAWSSIVCAIRMMTTEEEWNRRRGTHCINTPATVAQVRV